MKKEGREGEFRISMNMIKEIYTKHYKRISNHYSPTNPFLCKALKTENNQKNQKQKAKKKKPQICLPIELRFSHQFSEAQN